MRILLAILLIDDDAVTGAAMQEPIAGNGCAVDRVQRNWVQRLDPGDNAMVGVAYGISTKCCMTTRSS